MTVLMLLLAALSLAGIAGTVRLVARDGYRRIPLRPHDAGRSSGRA